jgi:glycosyltransferase involved in cell wall biosynthesis
LNILILISSNPYYESSASANRWLTLINGLNSLGLNISLLIYGGYISLDEKKIFEKEGLIKGVKYEYTDDIVTSGYLRTRFYSYFGVPGRFKETLLNLKNSLTDENYIVWTDSTFFALRMAVKLKALKISNPLFIELSEFFDIHRGSSSNFLHKFKEERRRLFFEKKAVFVYNGIALMTKTLLNYISTLKGGNLNLLHLPMTVDLERFNNDSKQNNDFKHPYILFVGNMDNKKDGVGILISSFFLIHSKYSQYNLYLVGGWNYDTPSHIETINKLGLQNKVFWKGTFDKEQIPSLMKHASLLVMPRPMSKQAQGGFPTKLGEYLASGVPVCATTVGEIPDYLVDNESVFFATPGSVESFADCMSRALSNQEAAKFVGLNGKKVACKFFNKNIQAKILYDFFRNNLLLNHSKNHN